MIVWVQVALNETYKLKVNHTNRMRPYVECSKVTYNYLFITAYLGTLLYICYKNIRKYYGNHTTSII